MNEVAKRMLMRRTTERRDTGERETHWKRDEWKPDMMMAIRAEVVEEDEPTAVLSEEEIREWGHKLKNADGSAGARYSRHEIERAAEKLGCEVSGLGLDELWIATNMMYSDYCLALLSVCPTNRDEEAKLYTHMGKAFLCDPDAAVDGDEKLGMYYRCIVG